MRTPRRVGATDLNCLSNMVGTHGDDLVGTELPRGIGARCRVESEACILMDNA